MENTVEYQLGDICLNGPLMNASGCLCTSVEELDVLAASPEVSAVVTKSCTSYDRLGNPEPRYYADSMGSINSNGLCNHGIDYYLQWALTDVSNTPKIISVAGLTLQEKIDLTIRVMAVKMIPEVNISCPNITGGSSKTILNNFLTQLDSRNHEVFTTKIGLKLPPLFYPDEIQSVANTINKFKYLINYVVCSNSLPNGLVISGSTEKPVIAPRNGIGGVGGAYLKPISLSNVYQLRSLIDPDVAIVGCGGVSTGQDVLDYMICGATAVQIGTQLIEEGISCFDRILMEIHSIKSVKS